MELTAVQRAELERLRCHLPATLGEQLDAAEVAGRVSAQTLFVVRPRGETGLDGDTWWITAASDGDAVAVLSGRTLPAMHFHDGGHVSIRSDTKP